MRRVITALPACILAALVVGRAMRASAAPCGANFEISAGNGGRFPDVAYNSRDGKFLAVYTNYSGNAARISGRLITADGTVEGPEFYISDATGGLYGAVAYNAVDNEFLVTWDDQRQSIFPIWGQRVRGSDGALVGGNFQIGSTGGIRSGVAWSLISNVYLVVWWGDGSETRGQRVSNAGNLIGTNFNISNDTAFSGYPAVAYGEADDQFLAAWDHSPNEGGYIRGQRVNAASGSLVGGPIDVSIEGRESRPSIAYDPGNARWLVQYNQGNTGRSYDQYAQLVSTDGGLVGAPIAIAATEAFEGETLLGTDVCFEPSMRRYLSSYQLYGELAGGMGSRQFDENGQPVGGAFFVSIDMDGNMANAADTQRHRCLVVWDRQVGSAFRMFGQIVPSGAITDLAATAGSRLVRLAWTNPPTPQISGTLIRYKTSGFPTGPADGLLLVNKTGLPGAAETHVHTGLASGAPVYYAAFAYDVCPTYAIAATAMATPGPLADFDLDGDVDQVDFGHLQGCLSGDGKFHAPGCEDADSDADGDVDQSDLNDFVPCFGGPNAPPGC